MKNFLITGFFFSAACSMLLTGCGDSVVSSPDIPQYATVDDLPDCNERNSGVRAFVEEEGAVFVCDAGNWRFLRKDEDITRDTVAYCGDEVYSVTEKTCFSGKVLLSFCEDSNEGSKEKGSDGVYYTCRKNNWVKTSPVELELGISCNKDNKGESVKYQYSNYVCRPDSIGWVYDFEKLNFDSLKYGDRAYRTVGIGSQMWMAENLDYRDEKALPNLEGGRKCYNNQESMCEEYGSLYNWAAAMNLPSEYKDSLAGKLLKEVHQGICPDGWHVPNLDDWQTLKEFVIDNNGSAAGSDNALKEGVGESLKDTTTWQDSDASGTDRFGFAAKGSGVITSAGSSREKNVFGVMHVAAEQPCGDKSFDDGRGCKDSSGVDLLNLPIRVDFRYDQTSLRYLQSVAHTRGDYMSVRCVKD